MLKLPSVQFPRPCALVGTPVCHTRPCLCKDTPVSHATSDSLISLNRINFCLPLLHGRVIVKTRPCHMHLIGFISFNRCMSYWTVSTKNMPVSYMDTPVHF